MNDSQQPHYHTDTLNQWGVCTTAIEMGWKSHTQNRQRGFAFPLYNLDGTIQTTDSKPVQRWKNIEPNAELKNLWIPSKPKDCLPFYFAPDVYEAVSNAGGTLYVVEGEKDVLTLMATGIRNALTWTDGATSIPKELLNVLRQLNIQQIIHLPDLDKAGRDSAKKLARLVKETTIAYRALKLPDELGEKGDVNDLWRVCQFDARVFQSRLDSCDVLIDQPAVEAWQEPVKRKPKTSTDRREDLWRKIEQELGVKGYKANGFSKPVHCPFHDDHNASAGWHGDKHFLKCFVCDEIFTTKQVAEKLGFNDFYQSTSTTDRKRTMNGNEAQAMNEGESAKELPPTHDEIGDVLLAEWDGDVAYFYGKWHHYEAGIWTSQPVDKDVWDVMKAFKPRRIHPSSGMKNSILDYLRSECFITSDKVDRGDEYVNLSNGLFSLKTLTLEPHQRDLYLTAQLPFAYDASAACPTWLQFLADVLVTADGSPDPELHKLVQEAFGYSLTADTHFEKIFMLKGDGATGKTTLLRVLKALLGSAACEIDFAMLSRESHQLANILGKRVVTASEADSRSRIPDAILKKLASGEEIVARKLYHEAEVYTSKVKLWWAMNALPDNADRSNGVYRRLCIIQFLRPIPEARRNPHLIDQLLAELPGIFNWALAGLARLQEQGQFTESTQVKEAVMDYRADNDVEAEFLNDEEWITHTNGTSTTASDLYIAYKEWCLRFGYDYQSLTKAGREWKRLGLEKRRVGSGNQYVGIQLTETAAQIVRNQRLQSGETLRR